MKRESIAAEIAHPDGFSVSVEHHLAHRYCAGSRLQSLLTEILDQLPGMRCGNRLSICMPSYNEGRAIGDTLARYSMLQKSRFGADLDPESFEINVLLNRPSHRSPIDSEARNAIERFQAAHPEYAINMAEVTFDFEKTPLMGTVFGILADATLARNVRRKVCDSRKKQLILRTTGADVSGLNPYFLDRTMEIFARGGIWAHRSESRLPAGLLKEFPLLHVMQTLAVFLLRRFHGIVVNGPFSYTAEAYCLSGGFDLSRHIGEEIDLSSRINALTRQYPGSGRFVCDRVHDLTYDPRRVLHALFSGRVLADRYNKFGEAEVEASVRAAPAWNELCAHSLPASCQLTEGNLSREVSAYYRIYLRKALASATDCLDREGIYSRVESIFRRAFRFGGISRFRFLRSEDIRDHCVEIDDISNLLQQMENRRFPVRLLV